MNMYKAIFTNHLYYFGDVISRLEYDNLKDKSQFKFWMNTQSIKIWQL